VEAVDFLTLPRDAEKGSGLTVRIEGDMVEPLSAIGTGEQSEVQPIALVDQEPRMAGTGEVNRQRLVNGDLTLLVELDVVEAFLLSDEQLDPCQVDMAVGIHGEGNGLLDVALTEQQTATPVPVRLTGPLVSVAAAPAEKWQGDDEQNEQDVAKHKLGVHTHSVCVEQDLMWCRAGAD
jgi:hypothetical protein